MFFFLNFFFGSVVACGMQIRHTLVTFKSPIDCEQESSRTFGFSNNLGQKFPPIVKGVVLASFTSKGHIGSRWC